MGVKVDQATVDQLKSFIKDKFPYVVQVYLDSAQNYVVAIEEGYKEGDAKKVQDAAHPLKSSSGNLGLSGLRELCEGIEMGARDICEGKGSLSDIEALIKQMPQAYDESVAFLKTQL